MKLASSMLAAKVAAEGAGDGGAASDCLKQAAPGPELLTTPEPRFYVLGSKSYGRGSAFLLTIGQKQVEAVVGMLSAELLPATAGEETPAEGDAAEEGSAGGAGEQGAQAEAPAADEEAVPPTQPTA